ncbi:MAG: cytochrome P450, partial [Acidobacteria bacterium]|nr:cytochrome P450 [Acidobacteriota bacterium]
PARRYVVMAGVDANRLVLRRGRELFHSAYGWHGFAAGFGASRMMIGMDGREHVRLRRAHRNGFARAALAGRTPDLMRIVRTEVQGWSGEPVPVVASVRRMVTEQLGTVVAGFSPRDYVDDLGRVVRGLLMAKVLGAMPRAWLWSRSYRRAHARVRELVDRVWHAHLERPEHMRRDLVDDLLALHAEDPQFLPETDLSVAMLGPFFAGLDTVTAAVSFSLHGLLGHPDLMREATREVDGAFEDGIPTAEQLDALDVTRRVVMEALRLYPVSPVTMRRAVNAFEFAGHVIPAGQELMIAFTLPHRLAEVFPDPLRFDIERFSESRGEHRNLGAYAPFGLGMHRCLGGNLAESLVGATIAGILRHARLEPYPPHYRLRVRQFPTVIPDARFRMRATARR